MQTILVQAWRGRYFDTNQYNDAWKFAVGWDDTTYEALLYSFCLDTNLFYFPIE